MPRLIDTKLTRDALQFATEAHEGQIRIRTSVPYIIHPYAVASLVTIYKDCFKEHYLDAYITALLHDVLEDTKVTYKEIIERTRSKHIADAVQALTKNPGIENQYSQLIDSLERAKNIGDWVLWIKAFDRIDNWNFALCPPDRPDEEFAILFKEGETIKQAVDATQGGEAIKKLLDDSITRYKLFAGL